MEVECERCVYKSVDITDEPCIHCTHNAMDYFKPMTNGDWLRSLNDEELTRELTKIVNTVADVPQQSLVYIAAAFNLWLTEADNGKSNIHTQDKS